MKKIVPLNNHVLIQPLVREGAFESAHKEYAERGIVVEMCFDSSFKAGDVIYFDSWGSARYEDEDGKEIWLVPHDKIRAYEVS